MPSGVYDHYKQRGRKKITTDETRKKMSESAKKRKREPLSEETKRKIGLANSKKKRTDEEKLHLSLLKKGKKLPKRSKIWCENLSNALKGNCPSIESREKNRKSQLKRWYGDGIIPERENRDNSKYRDWSKEVKKRDNWKCKICGSSENLEAHHILPWRDFPEERYNINNGITLCKLHHPHKHDKENRLINTFKELIKEYEKI